MEHIDETGPIQDEQDRVEHTDTAVIVTLLDPLTFKPSKMDEERTLDKLTLPRKVLGKHLKAMDQTAGDLGKSLALIAALARIPVRAAEELDARDIDLIMGVMEPFLPRLRATGRP